MPKKVEVEAVADNKAEEQRIVTVKAGNTVEEVIEWDQDGVRLEFDPVDFLKLDDEVVSALSRENFKNYYVGLSRFKDLQAPKQDASRVTGRANRVLGRGDGVLEAKLRIRKRFGWHQTWKTEREMEIAKVDGYVNVRKEKDGDKKDPHTGEVIGTGEIVKFREELPNGKHEYLYAVEIPEQRYQEHLMAVSDRSRERLGKEKVKARENIESSYPGVKSVDPSDSQRDMDMFEEAGLLPAE